VRRISALARVPGVPGGSCLFEAHFGPMKLFHVYYPIRILFLKHKKYLMFFEISRTYDLYLFARTIPII